MHRAHIDDAAAAGLVHMRQDGAGGEEGAVEMDRQHPAPFRQAEILQRMDDLDPGIADQDIHPAPGLDDCRDAVVYWEKLNEGYDAVFGSRFVKGGGVIDYPKVKYAINRLGNLFIKTLFRIRLNDSGVRSLKDRGGVEG